MVEGSFGGCAEVRAVLRAGHGAKTTRVERVKTGEAVSY